jgi:hypothetical protein
MADLFYVIIKIGGDILKENLNSILETLGEISEEGNIFNEEQYLEDGVIHAQGNISYDDFEEITSKIYELELTHISSIDPKDDCEGYTLYNIPPIHNGHVQSDINRHPIIRISEIRPYMDLLMDLVKNGVSCLPLHINEEPVKETVKEMINDPDHAMDHLQSIIDLKIPNLPKLPPLNILDE